MSDARVADHVSERLLVGVRFARDARLMLVQSAGHHPERGEPAVVELDGQRTLAVVEVPTSLIVSAPTGAGRGQLIAHGASDPIVRDVLVKRDAEAAATAQAVLDGLALVSRAQRSLDGAWVTIHLAAAPTSLAEEMVDRLAAALQAAIRLARAETLDNASAGEVSDVPDSLDSGEMSQTGQNNQDGKLESDD